MKHGHDIATIATAVHDENVARAGVSDFQIPAHFTHSAVAESPANLGWWAAELPAKRIGKMTVAGEPQLQSEYRQIRRTLGERVQ